MNDCRKSRSLMIEAIYGEISAVDKLALDTHLSSCPSCDREFLGMKKALKIYDTETRRDPGREFWDGYWDRLEARLDHEDAPRQEKRSSGVRILPPFGLLLRWAAGTTAALVLVVFGIFLGRTVLKEKQPDIGAVHYRAGQPVDSGLTAASAERARNYLERSKLVILGFVNYEQDAEDAYGLDFPSQKRVSRELVQEAAFLKTELSTSADKRLHELVTDLENILVQIANLKSENDIPAVDLAIKQGVKSKGLLLKINLTEMEGL